MLGLPSFLGSLALLAQGPPCPRAATRGDTVALTLSQVERRPVADSANSVPGYPPLLRQAGIQGPVRVSFTVDTAGRVEPASVRIVRSPNPGFDFAVKRAVSTWRYVPASLCGRPGRVRLDHEFAFRQSPMPRDTVRWAEVFDIDTSVTAVADTLPDGTPRTTVGWRATVVVVEPVRWEAASRDSAEEAALAYLLEHLRPPRSGIARVVCLIGKAGLASDPDSGRLVRLNRPGIAVLPFRRCPPTFVSMMYSPTPYPPGEDPFHIDVRSRTVLSATRIVFDVDVAQGSGGDHRRCGVERLDGVWRVRCTTMSSWFS